MSEQSLKIASWNIEDGLSKPVVMPAVVERLKTIDADIVALPEAFNEAAHHDDEQKAEILDQAIDKLMGQGYTVNRILYSDTDGRKDRHGFALLTRLPEAGDVKVFGLNSRKVLGQYLGDLSLTVVGVHLNDRQEGSRQFQAAHLLNQLKADQPNVVLGDFNAMESADMRARALRVARPLTRLLPKVDPGEVAPNLAKLRRVGSVSSRLAEMADGGTMDIFHAAGYMDVDPSHQPTRGPVELDHIVTNFDRVNAALQATSFKVYETPKTESDHRPISTVIEY